MKVETWYHDHDGLFLERCEGGAVRVVKTDGRRPDEGGDILFSHTFPPNIWASAVLSMSAFGERPCDWHRFMDYHAGKLDVMSPPVGGRQLTLGLDFGNVIKLSGQDQPAPGFVEALPALQKAFAKIVVISRVDDEKGEERARRMLHLFGLYTGGRLENVISEVRFCYYRHDKAAIAKELYVTHFVDDRTEVLTHMHDVPFRFALSPTCEQMTAFPPLGMFVAFSWEQLLPVLLATAR